MIGFFLILEMPVYLKRSLTERPGVWEIGVLFRDELIGVEEIVMRPSDLMLSMLAEPQW